MTEQTKAIVVSNYDKIKALAQNGSTVKRFADMLGSRTEAASYITSAMLVVANSDKLMECAPSSVFNTVMRAAALRLSCDPALRQAHIVPYWNNKKNRTEAQFIPGYIGLNNLAQRTGKYRYLHVSELFEGQILEINQLTGAPTIHGEMKSRTVIGYFHYFELFNGFKHIFYMDIDQLKAHGERYAPKNPMWKSDFAAMCKKTVTRLHLLKDGILDPTDRAIIAEAIEDMSDGTIEGDTIEGQFTEEDDAKAEQMAIEQREAKAREPKKTEAELMGAITGEPTPAATKPEPPAQQTDGTFVTPPPAPAMTLEEANAVQNSQNVAYGTLATTKLANMANGIAKALNGAMSAEDRASHNRKAQAIRLILAARNEEAQDEAAREAANE